jgi:hypothetical protein
MSPGIALDVGKKHGIVVKISKYIYFLASCDIHDTSVSSFSRFHNG